MNLEDFPEKLKGVNFNNNKWISYDVVSLFTNVSTKSTKGMLKEYVEDLRVGFSVPFESLNSLIDCVLYHPYFEFNGHYFEQIRGLIMSSSLSPILSNIFMKLLEKKYLKQIFDKFNIT